MIKYSIQTNGTLIDNQWIDLFKQYHFLVGISLDGIQITHDFHRRIKGEESFHKVIVAINLLKHNNIDFNILSVITSHMSMYAKDIYRFYKDMNFKYTQFIPCLPPLGGGVGLKPKEFFRFYRELYDEYRKDQQVHISLFDQIHYLLNGQIDCSCGMLGYCSIQIVIETDGSIYPCDFYALQKYCLGNILHHSLKECITNKIAYIFLREEKEYSYVCDDCEFYSICQGNCKRQNVCMFDEYYCGYKELLKYIKNKEDKHNENI